MPDEYTISDLTLSSGITNNDLLELSTPDQSSETGYSSVSATVIALANKILKGILFSSDLNTTDKTIIGAINEILASGGASIMYGTSAPTAQQGSNGNLYVQYTAGTGGASDTVDALFVKLDNAWCEISTGGGGGSGGHTIVDDSGTTLTQRTNLQFKGAYSEDNSTDDTTEVNVVRSMNYSNFQQLTEDEKKGFIDVTDIIGGNDDRFQPIIYSGDEREIGVWTDGKPLYEKTFTSTTIVGFNSDTEMVLNDNIPTGAEIKSIFGMLDLTLSNAHYVANSTNWFKYYFNVLTEKILASQSLASATPTSTLAVFTIQYTKSSDSAGSGQWTPQGVPAVHYSEDEHIVGTWIDGSTLYEITKTSQVAIPMASYVNIDDLTSLNIDTVIDIEGVMRVNEDGDTIYRDYPTGFALGFMYNRDTKYMMARQQVLSTPSGKTFITHYTVKYTKSST